MDTLYIEKLKKEYIDDVLEIETLCHGKHHWSRESFESEIDSKVSQYFCVLLNKKVIGFIGFWEIIDEAHVANVAVHPDFRRQGIARLLIITMLEYCYKHMVKFITLEVRVSNEPAKKLYEKFLFSSLGMRKCYYQDNNEDALIMWTKNIFDEEYKKVFEEEKGKLPDYINNLW